MHPVPRRYQCGLSVAHGQAHWREHLYDLQIAGHRISCARVGCRTIQVNTRRLNIKSINNGSHFMQ